MALLVIEALQEHVADKRSDGKTQRPQVPTGVVKISSPLPGPAKREPLPHSDLRIESDHRFSTAKTANPRAWQQSDVAPTPKLRRSESNSSSADLSDQSIPGTDIELIRHPSRYYRT